MSIEVRQLVKQFGAQTAVDRISFSVSKGEIVGFLGPNGAGKSTTMRMLTGYLPPDAGTALVNGVDVVADPIAVKRNIGYLPEANPLYFDLYVSEYLHFIAGVHQVQNTRVRIEEVIELTGLGLERKKRIGQLSKGYKQRVGLAAALIHNPAVLVLDEPTSGLDPNQVLEIRRVIKEQGRDKTILFSSHILQEVQAVCDRVVIISKGKLVADDTLANLQRASLSNSIKVAFKEVLDKEWLQRLPAALSIEQIDAHTWRIDTEDANLMRKQLLELSMSENLNIVALNTEGGTLEEIFRNLTTPVKS